MSCCAKGRIPATPTGDPPTGDWLAYKAVSGDSLSRVT